MNQIKHFNANGHMKIVPVDRLLVVFLIVRKAVQQAVRLSSENDARQRSTSKHSHWGRRPCGPVARKSRTCTPAPKSV